MVIKQVMYSPAIPGNDFGTYLIWCSLASDNIAAFNVGIQSTPTCPESIVPITAHVQSVDFNVVAGLPAYGIPTGCLTLTLEFF